MASTLPRRRRPLGWTNARLLAEALPALVLASLAVKLVPFRAVAAAASRWGRSRSGACDEAFLRKARWAVEAWARRLPWRAVCFQRGLALHLMLRRRGIPSLLHYGIAQNHGEGLRAHVWVTVGGLEVIGGAEAAGFTCVATFPPQLDVAPSRPGATPSRVQNLERTNVWTKRS